MSSIYVRDTIKTFLQASAPTETFVDLDAQYEEFDDLLDQHGLTDLSKWIGIEFSGDSEEAVTVPATNTTGKYREVGSVQIHIVDVAKLNVGSSILARGETIRNLLRGRRIDSIVIDSVAPLNFGRGTALEFENGQISGTFLVTYERDNDL